MSDKKPIAIQSEVISWVPVEASDFHGPLVGTPCLVACRSKMDGQSRYYLVAWRGYQEEWISFADAKQVTNVTHWANFRGPE